MNWKLMMRLLALGLGSVLAILLASGCDQLGLSGSGGAGGDAPPCNDVLVGPPVTPGAGDGAGGYVGAGYVGDSDTGSGDAAPQTCIDGSDLSTYIRCRDLTSVACQEACFNIGASCNVTEPHPYGSMAGGLGTLKQCQSNALNWTCTYCYPNGDVCTKTRLKGLPSFWLCSYTGGKGCD
ncbi:MAG: hypothetical protein QM820_17440 [Minicystis sp.]